MYQRTFSYVIAFDSEAHPGTGLAVPGIVDALVSRDGHGRFYLSEGTLKGMVRDGAERLFMALGASRKDPRIIALFGKEGRGKGDGGICSFPPALLRNLILRTSARYGNRVDADRRCVAEDFFFSRELLPKNAEFNGEMYSCRDLTSTEQRIVKLSLKMVETFGAKRTRGDGWARVRLDSEPSIDDVKIWLTELKDSLIQVSDIGREE